MNAISEFSGRSAFVTGAGTGIGAATAAELAARGARVAMMGRRAGMLEKTAAAIRAAGGDVLILTGDVANAKDVADAVGKTVAAFGGLHMAVNNAGVNTETATVVQSNSKNYREMVETNILGVYFLMKYEVAQMQKQGNGSIVNLASIAARSKSTMTYSASRSTAVWRPGNSPNASLKNSSKVSASSLTDSRGTTSISGNTCVSGFSIPAPNSTVAQTISAPFWSSAMKRCRNGRG